MNESDVATELGLPNGYLSWVVLRHFLPADELRWVCHAVVAEVSKQSLHFSDIARESKPQSTWNGTWMFEPTGTQEPLANTLWNRVRAIAWQLDLERPPPQKLGEDLDRIAALDKAIHLSTVDFFKPPEALSGLDVPEDYRYTALLESICLLQKTHLDSAPGQTLQTIRARLSKLELPLQSVALKHLGDLCADADGWDTALLYYREAEAKNQESVSVAPRFAATQRSIIRQSIATALWVAEGANRAEESFAESLRQLPFDEHPLFHANASHDILVAGHEASPMSFPDDRRASVAMPPLLQSTHDGVSAMRSWVDESSDDTPRLFWAALRRLVALGATTQSRVIKAHYARALVDGLERQFVRGRRAGDAFHLAVRLMIESTEVKQVKAARWSQRLIRTYVGPDVVADALRTASRHPGVKQKRHAVLVELFGTWLKYAGPEQDSVAPALLEPIIEGARTGETSVSWSTNAAGRCLDLLLDLARERLPLVVGAINEVAVAVQSKIAPDVFWSAVAKAIQVATELSHAFRQEDLSTITDQVLSVARQFNPASSPITGAVLEYLYTDAVRAQLQASPQRARSAIELVLDSNDGLVQTIGVLQFLKGFDASLFSDSTIAARLEEPVLNLRKGARQTNSSATVSAISTLLSVPAVSGADGVDDAFEGLASILALVGQRQASFLLPYAYEPLILLSQRWIEIADAIKVPRPQLRERVVALTDRVIEVWRNAETDARVFASFAIPENNLPNPTISHNWTVASLSLSRSFDLEEPMDQAITRVSERQPILRDAIAEGRRTFSRVEARGNILPLSPDDGAAFYKNLSEDLGRAAALAKDQADAIYERLLQGCLMFGPKEIDAAVFLRWVAQPQGLPPSAAHWDAYLDRLADSPLRDVLEPLLRRLDRALAPSQAPPGGLSS